MSAVSISSSVYLLGCRDDRLGKNCLGTITITTAQTVIDQPPERIIWCYSQWQPAYTQLLMMIPTLEFVKGIPESLENDSYLDVNIRNLIVIDDQMIEARKDNRIVNLFTKGSHHRNLSVIFISSIYSS